MEFLSGTNDRCKETEIPALISSRFRHTPDIWTYLALLMIWKVI